MKKLVLGCTLFISGFIGLVAIALTYSLYPYAYDSTTSVFLGFLSDSKLLLTFVLSLGLCISGLIISIKESYFN